VEAGGLEAVFVAAGDDGLLPVFGGLETLWLPLVLLAGGRATVVLLADGGMDLAVAPRLAGATLPPAARAGTALRGEKSPAFAVAAIAGLPPLFFASS